MTSKSIKTMNTQIAGCTARTGEKKPQSGWTIGVQPFILCGSLSSPLLWNIYSSISGGPLNQSHFVCLCVSWWVGEWQKCSASCGSSGQTKRTVLCIQAVSMEEQKALRPKDCEHMPKPESISSCNTHIPCPANWTTSGWSKVSQGFLLLLLLLGLFFVFVFKISFAFQDIKMQIGCPVLSQRHFLWSKCVLFFCSMTHKTLSHLLQSSKK